MHWILTSYNLYPKKTETIVTTNENLINKISLLDEAAQQDLLKFLDSFALKKNNCLPIIYVRQKMT